MVRLAAMALLAGLLLVTTACGSAANGYRTHVDGVLDGSRPRLASLERDLSTAIADRRTADAARAADRSALLLARLQASVRGIRPPASLAARSRRLDAAYGELVTSLRELAAALRAHAPTRVNGAIAQFNDARLDESSAVAALNGS